MIVIFEDWVASLDITASTFNFFTCSTQLIGPFLPNTDALQNLKAACGKDRCEKKDIPKDTG